MNENRTRMRAIALGMMIIGMAALSVAPSAQASGVGPEQAQGAGSCISVYTNGPGVAVDPVSCERIVKDLITNMTALP